MGNISTKTRSIEVKYNNQQVATFLTAYRAYNLNPVFQRKSVWKISDRQMFIKTILEGMPCPTVFVFNRWDKHRNRPINDVIDGKQRLETIYLFAGKLTPAALTINPMQRKRIREWLKRSRFALLTQEQKKAFQQFTIPVGQLDLKETTDDSDQGIGDVIDAFVRINTQGKPLTTQEKTNAHYIHSPLLQMAKHLSSTLRTVCDISEDQVGRMKDVEIALELLITLQKKESLDKKAAIVRALSDNDMRKKVITALAAQFKTVIGLVGKLHLGKNTRYVRRTSEFYSLFKAVMDLHNKKVLFIGEKGFVRARRELEAFSAQVAGIADAYAKKQFGYIKKHHNTPHYHYWMTTQSGTDKQVHRETRAGKLREIISRAFPSEKDKKRYFSDNQKEQVWAASKDKKCRFPGCGKELTWQDATIDHIIPWSQGGTTELSNAQLMCKKHNSMKGDKEFYRFFVQH